MKILHVFDHSVPLHSGYTFRSRAILEHQHKLGWVTDHVTSPKHNMAIKPLSDEEVVDDLHFFRTEQDKSFFAGFPVLKQLAVSTALEKRLVEIIPAVKPDILHAHSPALNGRAAINAGKRFGIPVVYEIRAFWEDAAVDHGNTTEGSLRYKLTRIQETKVAMESDAVTTICEGLRNDLINRGVDRSKITVIPNAVDIERFTVNNSLNTELVKKLGISGKKIIGFIGSFYAYEGLSYLVDAFKKITNLRNDVALLFVGGGPQEGMLHKQVVDNNLSEQVIFTGRVSHNEVSDYYNLVDIFVYPRVSKRITELVTPLKPLEAMAKGRLVVASDVGGHRELIQDGETGVLFKSEDASALADTILHLFDATEVWEPIKKAARIFVEKERNWKKSVSNYQQVYRALIDAS